jgi:hypothetical protein
MRLTWAAATRQRVQAAVVVSRRSAARVIDSVAMPKDDHQLDCSWRVQKFQIVLSIARNACARQNLFKFSFQISECWLETMQLAQMCAGGVRVQLQEE